MATVISPTDRRVIIEGVSWATYEHLLADFGDSHTALPRPAWLRSIRVWAEGLR